MNLLEIIKPEILFKSLVFSTSFLALSTCAYAVLILLNEKKTKSIIFI